MSGRTDPGLTVDGMPVMARELCELAARQGAGLLANLSSHVTSRVLVPGSNGSGKTTLLKLMDPLLRGAGATVSWFNLWQHKEDVDPFASLLFALWDELDVEGKPRCPQGEAVDSIVAAALRQKGYPSSTSIRQSGWAEGGERALLIAADLMGQIVLGHAPITELAHSAQLLASAGEAAGSKFQRQKLLERARSYQFGQRFSEQLAVMVQSIASRRGGQGPCFLFIDDIDRVPPALGLQLLEVVARNLNAPRLHVVVAVDENIARAWSNEAYRGNIDPKTYIDKMFDRRITGIEERARAIWAELLATEWRLGEWPQLQGKAHANLADKAIVSATRLLRLHAGSDIRLVRHCLTEIREIISRAPEFMQSVTLVPDIARLGVLCGYIVREIIPRLAERISDLRLLDARIEVIEQLMSIGPSWSGDTDEESIAWLREFLGLRPEEERLAGTVLDIRYYLPSPVLTRVGANLVLLGMGLR
ncbi:MAG: hypothetical protein HPKKFMNG_01260 [Planctomycetes bacterium]|nr:hypothetical protein [Planctomycetota bacterium]HRJ78621.1 P-loop NTPase fold protein [Planctomycetota bacterium]